MPPVMPPANGSSAPLPTLTGGASSARPDADRDEGLVEANALAQELERALEAWARSPVDGGNAAGRGPWEVRAVASTGSTNADLLESARQGHLRPQVLWALEQTAGRGRQGKTWHAQAGRSLTFSLALPLCPRHGWGGLSSAVGLALANALQPWDGAPPTGPQLRVKWPNDLWWFDRAPGSAEEWRRGRKVGGILMETLAVTAGALPPGTRWVVVGIGVNVHPWSLDRSATDQAPAWTQEWRPHDTPARLWQPLVMAAVQALQHFEREGLAPVLPQLQRRDLLVGQAVVLSLHPSASARCVGIDRDGALLVQTEQGLQRVVAGEVSVRPAQA